MKHKDKVKLAKQMMTREDRANGRGKFATDNWLKRRALIQEGIRARHERRRSRKLERDAR